MWGPAARRASPTSTATATSTPSSGNVYGTLHYFENTGTAIAPAFTERTGAANPFNGVDVGFYSTPSFADLDGDGDLDAVVGATTAPCTISATPRRTAPDFAEQTGAANPFNAVDVGVFSTPSFADLDGDGDLDAVVGEIDGTLHYFENTGSASAPAFTARTGAANPFNGVDVGAYSTPSFADLDGDGDLDAVVGEFYGTLHYFENTGSAIAPAFTERTGAANPFNGVDVGSTARPASPTSTATATSTPSSGKLRHPALFREHRLGHRAGLHRAHRRRQSVRRRRCGGSAARPASPTSTATATSTPSSGQSTAPCAISRTPARPCAGLHRAHRRRQSVRRRRCGDTSTPSFADLDGDGDLDAIVGETTAPCTISRTPARASRWW